jgi:hypothetical protein
MLLNAQLRTSGPGKNLVSVVFVAAKCTRAWKCPDLVPSHEGNPAWRDVILQTWKMVLCVYDTYLRGRSGGNVNAVVGLDALCPTLLVAGRVDSCRYVSR